MCPWFKSWSRHHLNQAPGEQSLGAFFIPPVSIRSPQRTQQTNPILYIPKFISNLPYIPTLNCSSFLSDSRQSSQANGPFLKTQKAWLRLHFPPTFPVALRSAGPKTRHDFPPHPQGFLPRMCSTDKAWISLTATKSSTLTA